MQIRFYIFVYSFHRTFYFGFLSFFTILHIYRPTLIVGFMCFLVAVNRYSTNNVGMIVLAFPCASNG